MKRLLPTILPLPITLLAASLLTASLSHARTAQPYPEAVRKSQEAARAVLARSGTESCLRGKLNRALLGLAASCAAAGERSPLCELADRAVVVTPMSLSFLDETARQLLALGSSPAADAEGSSPRR
jgi:hypothetical protein